MSTHRIRDPIHGFIVIDDLERDLINSRPFQRLRRVKQLAMTHMVYPGAVHTRFEHSLGVMQFATEIFDALYENPPQEFLHAFDLHPDEIPRARRTLRLAGLLHDVGHPPFSHTGEGLLPGGHEEKSVQIVLEREIKEIVEEAHSDKGIRVEKDLVPIILSDEVQPRDALAQLQNSIIAGPFGADRIDYLLRDSLHTGVMYGRFDAQRLIHTLTTHEDEDTQRPVLALRVGGLHAAEGLLLARYFMFQQVYFHAVRRIYDHHLVQFLREVLPDGRFPMDTQAYLQWDDSYVESELERSANEGTSGSVYSRLMRARQHYRPAFHEHRFAEYSHEHADSLRATLNEEFTDVDTFVDFERKELAKESELQLLVIDEDEVSTFDQLSSLFATLPPLGFFRVYAPKSSDRYEQVNTRCQQILESIRAKETEK